MLIKSCKPHRFTSPFFKRSFLKVNFLFILSFVLLFPSFVFAQNSWKTDIAFEARAVEIAEERENILADGTKAFQQNIKLLGLSGEYQDQEVEFFGLANFDSIKKNIYKEGDRVIVIASFNEEGVPTFYISDYVRRNGMLYLTVLFVFLLILIGGFMGFRSIISLAVTFLVLVKFMLPQILRGVNPLMITLVGSFFILLAIIYITEGFKKRSHIAVASIAISLALTILISKIFIYFTHLSGLAGEEAISLISLHGTTIDFQGLLLAGIIIGALGVLDDVVISQVVTVEKLIEANQNQKRIEIFKNAYEVGISHISSMTNTLFLAYAGASLPLLLFFVSGESAFSSWSQVINNEQIATEVVRTLAGSIGLILAVPIATGIAVFILKKE